MNDWAVYRLDYAGNEFVVKRGLSKEAANELVDVFERRKHHQHYWARQERVSAVDYVEMLRNLLKSGSGLKVSVQVLQNQRASREACLDALRMVRGLSSEEATRIFEDLQDASG